MKFKKIYSTICCVLAFLIITSTITFANENKKVVIERQLEVIEMFCNSCIAAVKESIQTADEEIKKLNGSYEITNIMHMGTKTEPNRYPATEFGDKTIVGKEIKHGYLTVKIKADDMSTAQEILTLIAKKVDDAQWGSSSKDVMVYDEYIRPFEKAAAKVYDVKSVTPELKEKVSEFLKKLEEKNDTIIFEKYFPNFEPETDWIVIKTLKSAEPLLDSIIPAYINAIDNGETNFEFEDIDAAFSNLGDYTNSSEKTKLINEVSKLAEKHRTAFEKKFEQTPDNFNVSWANDWLKTKYEKYDTVDEIKEFSIEQLKELKLLLEKANSLYKNSINEYQITKGNVLDWYTGDDIPYKNGEETFTGNWARVQYKDTKLKEIEKNKDKKDEIILEIINSLYDVERENAAQYVLYQDIQLFKRELDLFELQVPHDNLNKEINKIEKTLNEYGITDNTKLSDNQKFKKELEENKNNPEKLKELKSISHYSKTIKAMLEVEKNKLKDSMNTITGEGGGSIPYLQKVKNVVTIRLSTISKTFLELRATAKMIADNRSNLKDIENIDRLFLDYFNEVLDYYISEKSTPEFAKERHESLLNDIKNKKDLLLNNVEFKKLADSIEKDYIEKEKQIEKEKIEKARKENIVEEESPIIPIIDFPILIDEKISPEVSDNKTDAIKKEEISSSESKIEGTWEKVNDKWIYKDSNNNKLFQNSWAKIDGVWYKFDKNSNMLANTWHKENGTWYFLNSSGRMLSNEWLSNNGNWYFLNKSGAMISDNWIKYNDNWYFADKSGAMVSENWICKNGNWFWANKSGRISEKEWVFVNDKLYYAKDGGYLAINETITIDGEEYSFNTSGEVK